MTNQEPTPQEQQRFWDLQARRVGLLSLYKQGEAIHEEYGEEGLPDEVLTLLRAINEEYTRAEDAYQYFKFEHTGKSFRVFNPDDVAMAVDNEAEPLHLDDPNDPEPHS
jgi:hypothetical protein